MRLNAVNRRFYKGDVWTQTNTQDEDTGGFVPIYGFARSINLSLTFDQSFVFAQITTSEQIRIGSQVRGITDRNGDAVLGVGYAYEVTQIAPVTNVLGYVEEYTYKLKRVSLG